MKMERKRDYGRKRKRFLVGVALMGTISAGAREAGITWKTAKAWLDKDAVFQKEFEQALLEFKDSLEERALRQIDRKEDGATLRFKMRGEMPEKYGPRRAPAAAATAAATQQQREAEIEAFWMEEEVDAQAAAPTLLGPGGA